MDLLDLLNDQDGLSGVDVWTDAEVADLGDPRADDAAFVQCLTCHGLTTAAALVGRGVLTVGVHGPGSSTCARWAARGAAL